MSRASRQLPDMELPNGYERVLVDSSNLLLLPEGAARVLREELRQREQAAEEQRREDHRRRQDETREKLLADSQAAAEQRKSGRKAYGPVPEAGWYRVLPNLDALTSELEGSSDVGRSADKDVNERRARIHERLLALGPDRRVAHPVSWRVGLDELQASLPHFREPIRVLRNALALAEATGVSARIPPMLLLGPPGVGKTHFSHRVAELLGAPHASVRFDQPSAGAQLRGSDKYWSNSEPGLLFNLICLGECANPVVLLDELDKSAGGSGNRDIDPVAQLHGALERETARCLVDISVDIEFDASLVAYIATANTVNRVGWPILSRMEVFNIEPPNRDESFDIAQAIVGQVLQRFRLTDKVVFGRRAFCLLAHLSPRRMIRAVELAAAAAVAEGRVEVGEEELWAELGQGDNGPRLH